MKCSCHVMCKLGTWSNCSNKRCAYVDGIVSTHYNVNADTILSKDNDDEYISDIAVLNGLMLNPCHQGRIQGGGGGVLRVLEHPI